MILLDIQIRNSCLYFSVIIVLAAYLSFFISILVVTYLKIMTMTTVSLCDFCDYRVCILISTINYLTKKT